MCVFRENLASFFDPLKKIGVFNNSVGNILHYLFAFSSASKHNSFSDIFYLNTTW